VHAAARARRRQKQVFLADGPVNRLVDDAEMREIGESQVSCLACGLPYLRVRAGIRGDAAGVAAHVR
jgi:hypothetical protein